MSQVTKTTYATSVATLAPDNTSGQITAANVRSLLTDAKDSAYFLSTNTIADITSGVAGPGSSTNRTVAIANGTGGLTLQYSTIVIDSSNNIVMPTGAAFGTDTTTAHTALLQAYDVTNSAYKTFATLTNANTPSLAIAAPVNGTITIDGASVGATTPLDGHFTTLNATGAITGGSSSSIALNTNKFTVAGSSGNTLIAGTLNVTGTTTFATYRLGDIVNSLTAAGTNQGTAFTIAHEINRFTTVGAGTGAVLPAGVTGMKITIFNGGSNSLQVYASGSDTIDGAAAATGVALTAGHRCDYYFFGSNTWISAQLGVASA